VPLGRRADPPNYEVLEAIDEVGDGGPDTDPAAYTHLEEELGDLLFQIVFHSTLATEAGAFGLAEVVRGVHDKLVHRHPHVFARPAEGLVEVTGADDVVANWEQIKKAEKGRASVFDGIPKDLPALLYALKVQKKALALGIEVAEAVPSLDGAASSVVGDSEVVDDAAIGNMLMAAVAAARTAGVDPESALRTAATHLRTRARSMEA